MAFDHRDRYERQPTMLEKAVDHFGHEWRAAFGSFIVADRQELPDDGEAQSIQLKLTKGGQTWMVLLVVEQNIKFRLDQKYNATWRTSHKKPEAFDLVVVFYGMAHEPGDQWRASAGNKNKDDYRRASRGEDIERHATIPGLYNEIDKASPLTEERLKELVGVP